MLAAEAICVFIGEYLSGLSLVSYRGRQAEYRNLYVIETNRLFDPVPGMLFGALLAFGAIFLSSTLALSFLVLIGSKGEGEGRPLGHL